MAKNKAINDKSETKLTGDPKIDFPHAYAYGRGEYEELAITDPKKYKKLVSLAEKEHDLWKASFEYWF